MRARARSRSEEVTIDALREVNVAGQTPERSKQRRRDSRLRVLCFAASLVALATLSSCDIPLEPIPKTGFLAVILSTEGTAQPGSLQHYRLRIRELSGTYPIDQFYDVT